MSIASLAVRKPVATVAATLAVVLLGSVSLSRLPVSLLPDVGLPVLTIRTLYPSAAAEEVSRFVAEPIEEAIASTPGLVELRSVSRNGQATTTARFAWGTNMPKTVLDVREHLDQARGSLPQAAERPTLLLSDPGERPIAVLAVRNDSAHTQVPLSELARTVEDVHARRLEQIAGVASVAVVGKPQEEVRVELDPARLRSLGLTAEDVAVSIRAENAAGTGGTVRRGQFRFSVRALTEFHDVAEILATPIGGRGSGLTLRDVGTATRTIAEPITATRLDGATAIGLVVHKDAGSNTVAVSKRMNEAIALLQKESPAVQVTVVATQADFVVDALSNLGQEIVAGGVLSLMVILLFLRNWRVSFAIALVVPLSVLVALVTLQSMGVTINVLSLGGLALGVGLLVDTAIVVAESIGRQRENGLSLVDAAIAGTDDVAAPLIAGTLTTVLVFGPIIFVRGLAAALFRDLSLSVVTTVAASLLLALTLMPVMTVGRRRYQQANIRLPVESPTSASSRSALNRTLDRWGATLATWYEHGMVWSLSHPRTVFALSSATLVLSVALIIWLPKEVLPRVDEGALVVQLQLPEGTSLDATTQTAARVEAAARKLGSSRMYTRVGNATDEEIIAGAREGSSATAQFILPVPRGADAARLAESLRAALPDLAQGALSIDLAGQSEFGALIGREGRTVRVELSANTLAESEQWSDSVRRAMRGILSLSDVRTSYAATQPVVEISLERMRMAERGVAPSQVIGALSGALGGVAASDLRATDRRTPIVARYAGAFHENLTTALETPIKGVPVAQFVRVREMRAPLEVVRVGQRPVSIIEAIAERGGTAKAAADVAERMQSLKHPSTVQLRVAGADDERKRTSNELALVAVMAALLMFLVLAGEFASFTIPFVVMLTVPLAGAGAIILLALTGQSLNAVSLIGIVVMIGMADNEAVVKLDAIRKFREAGHSIEQAIILGGRQRLRAIAMTSITTVTGVLPLAFGWGSGGALYQPLAAGIIGGSVSALLVTFFLLPTTYAVFERRAEARAAARREE